MPRFSANFTHPLTYEKPFKFLCHLIRSLGINNIITMLDRNIHSAIFKLTRTKTRTRTWTRTWTRKRTTIWARTRTRTQTRKWNWNAFATYLSDALDPKAPYGLLVTHHSANSNGTINVLRRFLLRTVTVRNTLQSIC